MNKFKGIMAFMLILAISAGIATSEQVVTKEIMSIDGTPAPEQAINFTKLEISPSYVNFMLQPGESKEMTVTLKNKEKIAMSVKPNIVMAPYGGYNADPEWIKVTPESAQIPAGGSQKFTIKVTVPVDASIGNSGVQIAFTDETMPTPYPTSFLNYIHALQVSLDIWTTPKIQIMTPYINDMLEAGKEYNYEIKLKNIGKEQINIGPKMSSDNNRYNRGPGQMSAAFTDDAIIIMAPSNVPAGGTEIVKLRVKVPTDAKGSYNGALNLNIDDPSIREWEGMVQMNFNVWTQPAEAFERSFNLKENAPITIEIRSGPNYNYPYGQAIGTKKKEPSFETNLIGPAGEAQVKSTKTEIKGVVNMGGQIPPWELDSKGIYQENGVQLIETFKVSGSPGEWKLKVLPKNTESFEYSIFIGE